MKKSLLLLSAAAAVTLSPLAWAQVGPGPGPGPGGPGMISPDLELPPEIADLRDELLVLRESLSASRQAVLDALGPDATYQDRADALEEWRSLNDAEIAEVRALGEELRTALADLGIGGRGRGPVEIPEEIADARAAVQELARSLAESRRVVLAELGEDATAEERQAALEAWRALHADELADLEALRTEVSTWMRENRPARGPRPGLPAEVRERVQAFREDAGQMREARVQLRQRLQAAETPEERRQLMQQFREQYRQLMQERRELKRLERLAGDGAGGDRRPGG